MKHYQYFLLLILLFAINKTSAQTKTEPQTNNSTEIIDPVENSPEYPGGDEKLFLYVSKNLKWPKQSKSLGGRVIITFVVEKNGQLTHIKVIRGVDKYLDEEAVRVVRKSKRWHPATINSKPVARLYTVPISFEPQYE